MLPSLEAHLVVEQRDYMSSSSCSNVEFFMSEDTVDENDRVQTQFTMGLQWDLIGRFSLYLSARLSLS